jgi:hypothetical protein
MQRCGEPGVVAAEQRLLEGKRALIERLGLVDAAPPNRRR